MWFILMISMLMSDPVDDRPTVYIYVDVNSKDQDVVRRSKIIISELARPMSFMTKEREFINQNFKIEVRDAYQYQMYDHVPCIRRSKNSPRLAFPASFPCDKKEVGTFAGSGTFTIALHAHLKWEKYKESEWNTMENQIQRINQLLSSGEYNGGDLGLDDIPEPPKEKNPMLIEVKPPVFGQIER